MIIINKWLFLNRSNKNYRNKNHFQRMLAIIIPYFKINFFEKTLESLAQQTDKRFQVYIGDDASPVPPIELLEKYQGKFNFTYKKFNDNLGSISLVKQWERCIAMMQEEEWFMILGDDDVLGDNVVEAFYGNLSKIEQTSHVVRFSSVLINEKDECISKVYQHPQLENAIESYIKKLNGVVRGSLSEYIFRKESYNKFGFKNYALAWSTDDRAVIDFTDNTEVFSLNGALVSVRMSPLNISSNSNDKNLKQKAILDSTRELIFDHKVNMSKEQLKYFIQIYEHQIFYNNIATSKDYLNIIFLFLFFMPLNSKLYIFKTITARILNIYKE